MKTLETPFGLSLAHIEAIGEVCASHPSIEELVIFGSRAKGNYQRGSDIDLTIIGSNIGYSERLKIENELDDLLLPYKIDLSVFNELIDPNLIDHIRRVGKLFWASAAARNAERGSPWIRT